MSLQNDKIDQILGKDLDPTVRVVLERLIEAIQANFDHLSGEAIGNTQVFNLFVDQLQAAFDQLIADIQAELAEHSHTAEEVAEGDATAIDHSDLGGVTANQHHAEDHDHDGSPTQKLLAANTHESPSADTHHAQAHNHTAGDSSGVLTDDEHDGYSEYVEISTPSTPAANKGRLYLKDNGGGKTQLVVIFSGGAEIVLAVDP
jgi:hypothetical protein